MEGSSGTSSTGCASPTNTGDYHDAVIMKLYANPNVIDFSSADYRNQGILIDLQSGLFVSDVGKSLCSNTQKCGQYLTSSIKNQTD